MQSSSRSFSQLHDVYRVASSLPFDLNDTDAINVLYREWRNVNSSANARLLDIWTYCFVRRYFIRKFMNRAGIQSADVDMIIEKCLQKIQRHKNNIHSPDRYAHWVSVVCKNTFLNALRNPYKQVEMEWDGYATEAYATGRVCEASSTYQVVEVAINQLPVFLRDVARMRLLDGRSYDEISFRTGRALPIVRSYAHKAVKRLRRNPAVAELGEL